jgi:hypothetical protein
MAPCARVFTIVAGHSLPSGSGSYQRVRGRGLHRPRSTRSCSELGGISRRSRRQKVAGRTLDAQKKQFPPCPARPIQQQNAHEIASSTSSKYTNFGRQMAGRSTQNGIRLFGGSSPQICVRTMKSASRIHIFFAYRWRGMSSTPSHVSTTTSNTRTSHQTCTILTFMLQMHNSQLLSVDLDTDTPR